MADQNERLSKAAKELIEAAKLESHSLTQKQLSSCLEPLKESFDSKLNTISQHVQNLNENLGGKVDTLQEQMNSLTTQVIKVQSDLQQLTTQVIKVQSDLQELKKVKRLEMALAIDWKSHLKFEYYTASPHGNNSLSTSDLIRAILRNFFLGYGYILPKSAQASSTYVFSDERGNEPKRKEFREEIVLLVSKLIGCQAILQERDDGNFAIYHP